MSEMDQVQANQVQANQELVRKLMAEANADKNAAVVAQIQQGNKALIPVEINYITASGRTIEGTALFRRPSPTDYIKMGAIKSELYRAFGFRPIKDPLTGVDTMAHVDGTIKLMLTALSSFKVILSEPIPAWLRNYEDTEDADLLLHVYDRFEDELDFFRRQRTEQVQGASEGPSGTETMAPTEAVRGSADQVRGNTSAE